MSIKLIQMLVKSLFIIKRKNRVGTNRFYNALFVHILCYCIEARIFCDVFL